jgi:N-glycosylase/DNA lyase
MISSFIPPAKCDVLPGVPWGSPAELFTPAYWVYQYWALSPDKPSVRLGRTLQEEVAACLLNGYGVPAEVALAAYDKLRLEGLLAGTPCYGDLLACLSSPLSVGSRTMRYRFAQQKSKYLANAFRRIALEAAPNDPFTLRAWLTTFPGIGMKISSWIARNVTGSDSLAVLDVHLLRAGRHMGLFGDARLPVDYMRMESQFVTFAWAAGCRPSVLDALIWGHMRKWGHLIH